MFPHYQYQAPIVGGVLERIQYLAAFVKVAVGYAMVPVLQRCVHPTARLEASAG